MNQVTPHGLPFVEIPNDQVAGSARQFRESADFLYVHRSEHNCVSPLLVVAALGIELFLKSLNSKWVYHEDDVLPGLGIYRVTSAPLKKGHPLLALFDAIERPFREGLEQAYAATPVVVGKATIREALAAYDDLFVTARYPFEDGHDFSGRNITGLMGLLDFIGNHVGGLPRQTVR